MPTMTIPRKVSDLTKDERNLLLYLETRAVDHAGRIDPQQINTDDRVILDAWNRSGFVSSGRVAINSGGGIWCELSADAWDLAHAARRERGIKAFAARRYVTTNDQRAAALASYAEVQP